jgi:hypothetical protein
LLSLCTSYVYRYFIVLVEGFNCFLANEDTGSVVNGRKVNSFCLLLQFHGKSGLQLSVSILNLGVKYVHSYLPNRKPVAYGYSNGSLSFLLFLVFYLSFLFLFSSSFTSVSVSISSFSFFHLSSFSSACFSAQRTTKTLSTTRICTNRLPLHQCANSFPC